MNIATIVKLDENIEESVTLKIGRSEIEVFDSYGEVYPLNPGDKYLVKLCLVYSEDSPPIIIEDNRTSYFHKIGNTFSYDLIGRVNNGVLFVGDIKFYYTENPEHDDHFIKVKVDKIIVEFVNKI